MSIYIADSNIFIESHRKNYPIDVAHSYWEKFKQLADQEIIISIDKVKAEIYGNEDALKQWCTASLPNDFFKDTQTVIGEYNRVTDWAISKSNHYLPNALNEFLDADEADAFIIAYALSNPEDITIVTHEISNPDQRNKIKIPEPCIELDVQYINLIGMFRQLGETF